MSPAALATSTEVLPDETFEMRFEASTIKHLGLQMYSTLPPVISELVANAWDAGATEVHITIPEHQIRNVDEIVVEDNGFGMTEKDVQEKYLVIGRDRRVEENDTRVSVKGAEKDVVRSVMGRKGIGKLSGFGVAKELEIETKSRGIGSRFIMNYDAIMARAKDRQITFPKLDLKDTTLEGTRITLRGLKKYHKRRIPLPNLRRRMARQFSVLGAENHFQVFVNDKEISVEERDLGRLLDRDLGGTPYRWEYSDVEVEPRTGWTVSGWIGTLAPNIDDASLQRGIAIFARGKMVQSPFLFDIEGTQPYAFSYVVGEIHAEFVDTVEEDTVGTSRSSLVWDTDTNRALLEWGRKELKRIAKEWGKRRTEKNELRLESSELYRQFREETSDYEDRRNFRAAEGLIKKVIKDNPGREIDDLTPIVRLAVDFVQFDAFHELAEQLRTVEDVDAKRLMELFGEWQIVEAKEMMRVTEGRVTTIEKLETLIAENALEVPDIHNFLKEFPWIMDAKWTLVDDEVRYSALLRERFPDEDRPEEDRRIDFLCVSEGDVLSVVEIKRPQSKASMKELEQIRRYVRFMKDHIRKTTDPRYALRDVVGYLLVGDTVDTFDVREEVELSRQNRIYVKRYTDLLESVRKLHAEFLERYRVLKAARTRTLEDMKSP